MPAHYITRYWEQEQRVFVKNSRLLQRGHNPDALHDMRVAVKKLRATLEAYIQLTAEPFWENPLSETETLFATVGRLRDVEICQELLREHQRQTGESFPAFRSFLQSQYRRTRRWSLEALAVYRSREIEKIGGFLKSENAALLRNAPPERFSALIAAAWKDVPELFRQPHALRKHLKKVYYWMKMQPEDESRQPGVRDLAALLDQLGAWQDRRVLYQRLRHFRKDFLPETFPEYTALKHFAESLQAKNRTAVSEVIRTLKKMAV